MNAVVVATTTLSKNFGLTGCSPAYRGVDNLELGGLRGDRQPCALVALREVLVRALRQVVLSLRLIQRGGLVGKLTLEALDGSAGLVQLPTHGVALSERPGRAGARSHEFRLALREERVNFLRAHLQSEQVFNASARRRLCCVPQRRVGRQRLVQLDDLLLALERLRDGFDFCVAAGRALFGGRQRSLQLAALPQEPFELLGGFLVAQSTLQLT